MVVRVPYTSPEEVLFGMLSARDIALTMQRPGLFVLNIQSGCAGLGLATDTHMHDKPSLAAGGRTVSVAGHGCR